MRPQGSLVLGVLLGPEEAPGLTCVRSLRGRGWGQGSTLLLQLVGRTIGPAQYGQVARTSARRQRPKMAQQVEPSAQKPGRWLTTPHRKSAALPADTAVDIQVHLPFYLLVGRPAQFRVRGLRCQARSSMSVCEGGAAYQQTGCGGAKDLCRIWIAERLLARPM